MKRTKHRVAKICLIVLASIIGFALILGGSYVGYVSIQYYRIDNNIKVAVETNVDSQVAVGSEYKISTYNIGFGAYSQEYSFFMDTGVMQDGTAVSGKSGKAKDKKEVIKNTNGAISTIQREKVDFAFFQEVDTVASRSYKVNQFSAITEKFPSYATMYAENFHSAYLMYPFNDPHGKTNAGIVTLSNKKVAEATRYSFPVDNGFPTKFFDLDRCFMATYLPIAGTSKKLCLINLHMSAYDKGGTIRAQQLVMLNEMLAAEKLAGNYVIAGGDFNHDIANSSALFPSEQKLPEWIYNLDNTDLATGYTFAAATNAPTCRGADIPYTKGVNFTVVIDGFIVSDNIKVVSTSNIDTDFMYSDHNPAVMQFKLANF